jgi:hypothetical protein
LGLRRKLELLKCFIYHVYLDFHIRPTQATSLILSATCRHVEVRKLTLVVGYSSGYLSLPVVAPYNVYTTHEVVVYNPLYTHYVWMYTFVQYAYNFVMCVSCIHPYKSVYKSGNLYALQFLVYGVW